MRVTQRCQSTRLLVVAITTLLTGSLADASRLVLCLGTDGHSAIEFEHNASVCPTLASSQGGTTVSVQSQVRCLDVPSAGTGPITASAFHADGIRAPLVAFMVPVQKPTARIGTEANARAGPLDLARHLRSTVLLV